jgi:hypothetical protein
MRPASLAGLIASIATLGGCGGHGARIDPNAPPMASRWTAVLATPAQLEGAIQVSGTAWMGAKEKDTTRTLAHIEIANALKGARYPWHVHTGHCGLDQGVLATEADAYPVLKVGGNGTAKADADLRLPVPKTGQYYVDVHASPTNMQTIIACGNMAPPAQ